MDSAVQDEKASARIGRVVNASEVDIAAQLASEAVEPLAPEVAKRLRRKIDLHIMPLMCIMNLLSWVDKVTLGLSAILGIIPGAHLSQDEFNWLGTIFYLSYLAFQYPQNLALQRFPVAKWMSINFFIWAIAIFSHVACKSFGALLAVRIILGISAVTPGFMIISSMFYTREEQTKRVGYWYLMGGIGIIFVSLLTTAVLQIPTHRFMPWQWLMIITGILTFITSVLFWFFFPDSPTTAYFLTPEERIWVVERIKSNQSGMENKLWKRKQFIEALCDRKIWLMTASAALTNVYGSVSNQKQLIITQFGFTVVETTLIGCVNGAAVIFSIWIAITVASQKHIGHGFAAAGMCILGILGAILLETLPSHNKIGLLFSFWVSTFCGAPFVIVLGWVGSIASGHTKRTTASAMILIASSLGNAMGNLMWRKWYQPRYRIPWTVIAGFSILSGLLLLILRYILQAENKRRDSEVHDDTYDDVYILDVQSDGMVVEKKVDKAFLDLTDTQNRDFRYSL